MDSFEGSRIITRAAINSLSQNLNSRYEATDQDRAQWAAEELAHLKCELPVEGKRVLRLEGDVDDITIHFEDGSSVKFGSSQSCLHFNYKAAGS